MCAFLVSKNCGLAMYNMLRKKIGAGQSVHRLLLQKTQCGPQYPSIQQLTTGYNSSSKGFTALV